MCENIDNSFVRDALTFLLEDKIRIQPIEIFMNGSNIKPGKFEKV